MEPLLLALFAVLFLSFGPSGLASTSPDVAPAAMTESELLSSSLWLDNAEHLLLLLSQAPNSVPPEAIDAMSPLQVVEVSCSDGADAGNVCSMLSVHEGVLSRGGGVERRALVGLEAFSTFQNKVQYFASILQKMIGESMSTLSSHSSLVSFTSESPQCLLALVTNTSSPEYLELLGSFMFHRPPGTPLGVVGSREMVPLLHRPPYQAKEPPLYLFSVRESGSKWYRLFDLKLISNFVLRSSYPVIVNLTQESNILKEFRNKNMHLVLFFPALPASTNHNLEKLVEKVANKLYLWFIFILADRFRDSAIAKRYSIKDSERHVVLLPRGLEKKLAFFPLPDKTEGDLEKEVMDVVNTLLGNAQDIDGLQQQQQQQQLEGEADSDFGDSDGDVPPISVTTLDGVDLIVSNAKHSFVVAFCKKGEKTCPDEIYFTLESVAKILSRIKFDLAYKFMAVDCRSVKSILKYGLNSLPAYALFNSTTKSWRKGVGNVNYYKDILATIAEETGRRELMELSPPTDGQDKFDELLSSLAEPAADEDIYAQLGRTMPNPSLPKELVLTDQDFEDRIMATDKTAILFYLSWSVESKVLLYHLLAAWEQLDKGGKVALGCVDCHDYTQLCSRYQLASLPTLLVFTPSTLHTPSPPPSHSVGVLDSTRFLEALGQHQSHHDYKLKELTPASLPTLLGQELSTPLVVWCGKSLESELARAFVQAAHTLADSAFSFAWLNSSKHSELLESAFGQTAGDFPAVLLLRLDKSTVYQMESSQPATFSKQLDAFLHQAQQGTLTPTRRLTPKTWPPLHPPFPFPSKRKPGGGQMWKEEEEGGHEEIGEFDADILPHAELPQVRDYPVFEDKNHKWEEEEMVEEEMEMAGDVRRGRTEL